MFQSTPRLKFMLPAIAILALSACGSAPVIPPTPPVVVVPSLPANPLANLPTSVTNQLNNLPTNLPNTNDLNSAMQGLNALGQLGAAMGQNAQIANPTAMSNFMDAMQQMENQYAMREYQDLGTVDMPDGTPEAVNKFAYANGKLTEASFSSMDPMDLRLGYKTTDSVKVVGDYYRNLVKTSVPTDWKVKGQTSGTDRGSIELQMKQGTRDDRIVINFEKENGLTDINIRYYTFAS